MTDNGRGGSGTTSQSYSLDSDDEYDDVTDTYKNTYTDTKFIQIDI